jgi:L-asparaginase
VNLTRLPAAIQGVRQAGNQITTVNVPVKDSKGDLLATAIPKVTIFKYAQFEADTYGDDPAGEVEVTARIEKNLQAFPLSGFVLEGNAPYGDADQPLVKALNRGALRGMPVVRVGRGNNEGFSPAGPSEDRLQINGGNLTSTKARLLLMASLMKLGSLPVPANPERPTKDELRAIVAKLRQYQEIFDTH